MIHEWTNIQIMECNTDNGVLVTVFWQSDGASDRYVLGNGQAVDQNYDGTFTIHETQTNLSLAHY